MLLDAGAVPTSSTEFSLLVSKDTKSTESVSKCSIVVTQDQSEWITAVKHNIAYTKVARIGEK